MNTQQHVNGCNIYCLVAATPVHVQLLFNKPPTHNAVADGGVEQGAEGAGHGMMPRLYDAMVSSHVWTAYLQDNNNKT